MMRRSLSLCDSSFRQPVASAWPCGRAVEGGCATAGVMLFNAAASRPEPLSDGLHGQSMLSTL